MEYDALRYDDYDDFVIQRVPYEVEFNLIGTTLDECTVVPLGPVGPAILEDLNARSYDQAPVRVHGGDGIGWRLVATSTLESLARAGEPLTAEARHYLANDTLKVGLSFDIEELFTGMRERRAAILFSEPDSSVHVQDLEGETVPQRGVIHGLVTLSDLNAPVIRRAAYEMILDLEISMSQLLQRAYPEPWDWIQKLSEDSQVQVLGFWEVARRRQLDRNPIAAATLTHLLQAIAKSKELLPSLDYRSKGQFEAATGKLIALRNVVMHPVRPLVLAQPDVEEVQSKLRAALELIPRLEQALRRIPAGGRPREGNEST